MQNQTVLQKDDGPTGVKSGYFKRGIMIPDPKNIFWHGYSFTDSDNARYNVTFPFERGESVSPNKKNEVTDFLLIGGIIRVLKIMKNIEKLLKIDKYHHY